MTPFQQATVPEAEKLRTIEDAVQAWRHGNAEARAMIPALDEASAIAYMRNSINRMFEEETVWLNNTYQVHKRPFDSEHWPNMIHLSVKRIDRRPIHDWRELQEIKNRLVGPEHEAVELYPAESRRVDTANQYHLFVLDDPAVRFPFGFADRLVLEGTFGKAKQRPLP